MNLEIGNIINLNFGKEYIILNDCKINDNQYYLISNVKDVKEVIIIEKKDEDVRILQDESEVGKILEIMSK